MKSQLEEMGTSFAGVNHRDLIDFRASLGIEDVAKSSFEGIFREMFPPWSPVNLPVILRLQRAISVELAHKKKKEGERLLFILLTAYSLL